MEVLDSRFFGFVPQENLQGSPSLTIWPPNRFGIPNQKPYPWLTFPNVLIWTLALSIGTVFFILHLRKRNKPLFKKLSS
jgi:signal peptidase I